MFHVLPEVFGEEGTTEECEELLSQARTLDAVCGCRGDGLPSGLHAERNPAVHTGTKKNYN